MNGRFVSALAWLLCTVIIVSVLFDTARALANGALPTDPMRLAAKLVESVLPFTFAFVGTLILSRQARNVIGWLLIIPALAFALNPVMGLIIGDATTGPAARSFWWYLALYLSGVGWVFFIFPLFLIALLFPTGKPVSPRWRWAVGYAFGLLVFFLVVAALTDRIGPFGDTGELLWSVPNPIGFLTQEQLDVIFGLPWGIALGALTLLSAVSVIVRYRGAGLIEREQMKWLLSAVMLFAAAYIPGVLTSGEMQGLGGAILNILFLAGALAIPIAIGIAVMRYRLFDIDIIIRRTLIYSLLTAMLALFYFGSVVVLQQILRPIIGAESDLAIIISTLTIAALSNPLRHRVQNAIDHRFYRRKYDAQKVLERFGATARDEVELEKLTGELLNVVTETMQPESACLWLKQTKSRGSENGRP